MPAVGEPHASEGRRVLVTGASGFVGGAVVRRLSEEGSVRVRAALRAPQAQLPSSVERVRVGDLRSLTDWHAAVERVDVVVHAAARVHVMRDSAPDPLSEFRAVNVAGTLAMAQQAAQAGVRRFVFISTIKVNGEETTPGRPFTERDTPAPADPYGVSKLEAEQGLRDISFSAGMELVIIRPVLTYGPGVRANFLTMMRGLRNGLPLPLGAIDNRRSLVALDNLSDFIAHCTVHPSAAGQTFLVSDGEDLSTPELLRRTAAALGITARLIPVPVALIEVLARAAGRGAAGRRLSRSLQVDITKARDLLGWSPPVTVDDALARTAEHFLRSGSG